MTRYFTQCFRTRYEFARPNSAYSADRITREAAHQTIIIGELLNRGKQLTIGGKDYQQNPENKLTLSLARNRRQSSGQSSRCSQAATLDLSRSRAFLKNVACRRALDGRNGTEIEMIRATLLVPENLRACMEGVETGRNDKHEHLLRQLERLRPTCVAW